MAFLPTNANQLQAYAGALYGLQIGSKTLTQVNTDIAAVGSLNGVLNSYFQASFGGLTTTAVADTIVKNVGLTDAAATAATNYVKGQLDAAPLTARGEVVNSILSAFSNMASDATYGAAATAWTAKVQGSVNYAGEADVAIGTTTSTTGTSLVLTDTIDNIVGTSNDDTLTASEATLQSSDIIDLGAGTGDVLDFVVSNIAADQVFSPRLKNVEIVSLASDDAAQLATFSVSQSAGLTTVRIGSGEGNIAVSNATKALAYEIAGNHNTNAAAATQFVSINLKAAEIATLTDTLTVTMAGGQAGNIAVTNGIETLNLNVTANSVIGVTDAAGTTTGSIFASTASAAFTTLEKIAVTGAGNLTVNGAFTSVDADGNFAFDASAATGKIAVQFNNGGDTTATGGSADDTFRFATGDFDAGDVVVGGSGADTLRVNLNTTNTRKLDVTEVETLRLNARTIASSINVDGAGFDNIRIDSGASTGASAVAGIALTLRNLSDEVLVARGSGTATTKNTDLFFNNLTLDYKGTDAVSSSKLEVSNGGVVADDLNLGTFTVANVASFEINAKDYDNRATFTAINGDDDLDDLTVTATAGVIVRAINATNLSLIDASAVEESFTLQTAALGGVTFGAAGATATDFEVVGAKGDNTINLIADAAVVGNDITVTTEDGDDSVTIDSAAAITGDIDISTGKGDDTVLIGIAAVVHTGAISVDSGEGDDVVTIDPQVTGLAEISGGKGDDALTGGSGADDITGGDGDDVITGGDGTDAMNGGLGGDTFAFVFGDNAGANAAAVADVITGFVAGTDDLQFVGIADIVSVEQTLVQAAVTALAAGSTDAQIATAMALANLTGLGVSFAVFNGSTYVYLETTGATATHVEAANLFIKLTGVTTLPTFAADVIA
jgi:hypothetical protein